VDFVRQFGGGFVELSVAQAPPPVAFDLDFSHFDSCLLNENQPPQAWAPVPPALRPFLPGITFLPLTLFSAERKIRSAS
jgi:hypothetical protein